MPAAPLPETLDRLRRAVAAVPGMGDILEGNQPLAFGLPEPDRALGGGLPRAALHDIAPATPLHRGGATGFVLGLAIRAAQDRKSLLWIQTDYARQETGIPYGPGLEAFGLPMERVILLRLRRAADALWAMEEGLKCRALAAAIAEMTDDEADLTATRRLSLAARDSGGLGFLLRHAPAESLSAAATRWEVASVDGARDVHGGLGATTFSLSLLKNRRGPCGRWIIRWDHHARAFAPATLPLGVAAAARDGSDRARLGRAG